MKLLAIFAFVISCLTINAAEPMSQEFSIQKLYVDPANVVFDSHEIHVLVDSNWITTDAVFTDTSGFYVDADKIKWLCPNCKKWETESLVECSKCHYRR
jgi:lipopolysaccharide biosynthesis regulator YciM